jgi:hypothetical protein
VEKNTFIILYLVKVQIILRYIIIIDNLDEIKKVNLDEIIKNQMIFSYEQTDYIPLLESNFGINIFKLIENKSLTTFYDIFNKIDFKTSDTKYNVSFSLR